MSQKKPLNKSGIVLVIILMGVSYGVGRYLMPAKLVEVEKTVEKERIKTITVTKEVTRPDGTTEKETIVKEDTKKSNETDKSVTVVKNDPQWMASVMMGKDTNWETTMGVAGSKRILGNLWLGAYVIPMGTKMQAGGVLTYEF